MLSIIVYFLFAEPIFNRGCIGCFRGIEIPAPNIWHKALNKIVIRIPFAAGKHYVSRGVVSLVWESEGIHKHGIDVVIQVLLELEKDGPNEAVYVLV